MNPVMTKVGAAVWDHGDDSPGLQYFGRGALATARKIVKTHRTVNGVAHALAVPLYARDEDVRAANLGRRKARYSVGTNLQ